MYFAKAHSRETRPLVKSRYCWTIANSSTTFFTKAQKGDSSFNDWLILATDTNTLRTIKYKINMLCIICFLSNKSECVR